MSTNNDPSVSSKSSSPSSMSSSNSSSGGTFLGEDFVSSVNSINAPPGTAGGHTGHNGGNKSCCDNTILHHHHHHNQHQPTLETTLESTTDFVTASTENLTVNNSSGRTSAPPYSSSDSSVLGPFPPKKMDGRRTFRRTRSLNAPSPIQQFGPCGRIQKNSAMVMQVQDPAFQRLTWYKPPLTVLVIKKIRDVAVLSPFVQLVRWLIMEKRMVVHVESSILSDVNLITNEEFKEIREKVMVFQEGRDDLTDKIDFIICLGGDGTLLYASSLFQQSVPPVMAFHLGSLGFLTPFVFDNFQQQVTNALEGSAALTLRSRLKCTLKRRSISESTEPLLPPSAPARANHVTNGAPNGMIKDNRSLTFLVLNEVVVDRGPSPYLSNVDLFIDGKHVTVVQGDGLIVSTPTGSTAYAVAAGASMIHPSVPAIMITPICPHSLSFRPIVVPAGVELKIKISPESRNTAWVSFDGRSRQELRHGDALSVTTSVYPLPSLCAQDQISDWFDSLADCLQWNVRKRQQKFEDMSMVDSDIMEN